MAGFFGRVDPVMTAVLLAVVMLAAWSVGFRSGRKSRRDAASRPAGKFEDAVVAILGLLLFFAGAISTMLVGREQGASEKPPLAGTMSFLLLVTLVVFVILDLNEPVRGLIAVSQEPMQRVLESMGK